MSSVSNSEFFRELIYLYNSHKKYNTQLFSELGLSTGQPKVLSILLSQEGCIQKDLAERCMVEPATMTSLLSHMEKAGLICKKSHHSTAGKRSMAVYLTDKGRETAEKVHEIVSSTDDIALAGLSDDESRLLINCMQKCRTNLEAKYEEYEKERRSRLFNRN